MLLLLVRFGQARDDVNNTETRSAENSGDSVTGLTGVTADTEIQSVILTSVPPSLPGDSTLVAPRKCSLIKDTEAGDDHPELAVVIDRRGTAEATYLNSESAPDSRHVTFLGTTERGY
jgi:hypothetical protein